MSLLPPWNDITMLAALHVNLQSFAAINGPPLNAFQAMLPSTEPPLNAPRATLAYPKDCFSDQYHS
ncbi:hypothetical protein E2C01_045728 [Portunus trituberculatus]|uniref:Uncharacterized protein n=1 Tax=Portunus trituberculatus TaxID=210409 RepID=A0A5B7FZ20_PORTR|nr:hypothetical protein [Portunus trituberculatus]